MSFYNAFTARAALPRVPKPRVPPPPFEGGPLQPLSGWQQPLRRPLYGLDLADDDPLPPGPVSDGGPEPQGGGGFQPTADELAHMQAMGIPSWASLLSYWSPARRGANNVTEAQQYWDGGFGAANPWASRLFAELMRQLKLPGGGF